jgi:hypothetical protein
VESTSTRNVFWNLRSTVPVLRRWGAQHSTAMRQVLSATAVRQQAVGTDSDKALKQNVLDETAEKVHRLEAILKLRAGGWILDRKTTVSPSRRWSREFEMATRWV